MLQLRLSVPQSQDNPPAGPHQGLGLPAAKRGRCIFLEAAGRGQGTQSKGASLLEALPISLASRTLTGGGAGALPHQGRGAEPWRPPGISRSLESGLAPTHLESLVDVPIVVHHFFAWFPLAALQDKRGLTPGPGPATAARC